MKMKKTRLVVDLYNEAVKNDNKEDIILYDAICEDQRDWEKREWNHGFNWGYASAAMGVVLGVTLAVITGIYE